MSQRAAVTRVSPSSGAGYGPDSAGVDVDAEETSAVCNVFIRCMDLSTRHTILHHAAYFNASFGPHFVTNFHANLLSLGIEHVLMVDDWSKRDINLEEYISQAVLSAPMCTDSMPAVVVQPAPGLFYFLRQNPLGDRRPLCYINDVFMHVFGWDMDTIQMEGLGLPMLYHKDDLTDGVAMSFRALLDSPTSTEAKSVIVNPSTSRRHRIMCADGSFMSCLQERHILLSKMRLPAYIVCFFTDMRPADPGSAVFSMSSSSGSY
eukprot:TRINITY_DN2488_c1_g1_i3.p1 TRINITY_DN2488_c1_g1~~TRINITY_DN2488_c1_g1_i3.p1  ORF type:complete len:262 (+),score=62.90 TRINITY_DN2488_c1_g1_i3:377-1162(+)